jgi:hypothetical protein
VLLNALISVHTVQVFACVACWVLPGAAWHLLLLLLLLLLLCLLLLCLLLLCLLRLCLLCLRLRLLLLTIVDANVADVWVCEHHKLALVGGVSHDLLVPCMQQHSTTHQHGQHNTPAWVASRCTDALWC